MEFGYSLRLLSLTVMMSVTMAAVSARVRRQAGWNDPDHPFPDSSWSGWTPCTKDCGGGYQARHNCTPSYQMPPVGGPVGLEGNSGCFVHTLTCNLFECDDDFDWQDFTSCDGGCGGAGMRQRYSGPSCGNVCNGQVVGQGISCNTHSCTPPSDCGKADVIFILDSSGSVGELNWYRMKQFAIDVSKSLAIGPDASRVAAISYSNEVSLSFDLEAGETIAAVEASLWSMPWMASSTNTADGMRLARDVMASQARDGVTKIMVVVTDGNSNVLEETTLQQAELARDEGSVIFGVGVSSNINNEELEGISSQPADDFVFHVDSFEGLSSITEAVASTACDINDCGPWSEPSPCPVTCGGGLSTRTRTCTEDGQELEEEDVNVCGATVCPRTDCSDWEPTGACSVTCGDGLQLYERECWEVLQDGADGQVFPEEEYRSCNGPVCPCETEWAEGDCSVSCGSGTRVDQRTCPTGVETRTVSCSYPMCPCEEEWARGECSVTCGTGTREVRLVRGCNQNTPIVLGGRARDYFESCTMKQECMPDCSMCDYGNSIGYIPHPTNCSKYYICVRHVLDFQRGEFLYTGPTLRSCGPGTKWDQVILQCVHDWTNECGAVSDPGTWVTGCNYVAVKEDITKMRSKVDGTIQSCGAGTVFNPDQDVCVCVHGYNPATAVCEDDLLLHYTFDDDFNSVTCHTAPAENYGQVVLSPESSSGFGKSAYFDGQSRLVVHFMENYFAGNQIEAFTVALWYRWEGNGGGIQGLVNNGNCEGAPTFDLHVGATQVVSGSMDTTSQPTTSVGEFWTGKNYWQHVALVYDGNSLTFYLNCAYYVSKPLQGPIQNNPDCPMTIGQLGPNPDGGLFTGYIDDLRVYTRALSYADVQGICQSNAIVSAT